MTDKELLEWNIHLICEMHEHETDEPTHQSLEQLIDLLNKLVKMV